MPKHLRRLAAAGLVAAAAGVQADEWVIDRSLASRLSYADNITMRSDEKLADSYLTVTPGLGFSSRTEARDIGLNLSVGGNWYRHRSEYNATDYSLRATSKWLAESNQWNLAASSVRDSTLQNESRQSELATTGVVTTRRQRTQDTIQGGWFRRLGDAWSANVGYIGNRVSYENGPGLVDYEDQTVSGGLSASLSERTALTLSLSSRDFNTLNNDTQTKVDAVSLGGNWQWSERLDFGLNVGRQWTENDQKYPGACVVVAFPLVYCYGAGTTHSESTSTTYSGNVDYQFDQGSFGASLSRGLNASGTGALLRTDSAGLGYSHRIDETLSFSLGAGQTRSRNIDNGDGENRYSTVSSSLNWQLEDRLQLGVGFTHAQQRAADRSASIRGNVLFVALTWNLAPLSRSW